MHFLDVEVEQDDEITGDTLTLPGDIDQLAAVVEEVDARLLVLDPLVSYLPAEINAHRDQHVRRVLAPLARMADLHGLAIVAVIHLNKSESTDSLARVSGSVGFAAAARSVLILGRDPDDPDGERGNRRVLAHAKCNLAPLAPSLQLRIEPRIIEGHDGTPIETSRLTVIGQSDRTAGDLLGQPVNSDELTARGEAREFLRTELADGPVAAKRLEATAKAADLSWRTVQRAKKQAGVRSRKVGTEWMWELANTATSTDNPLGGLVVVGGLDPAKTANDAKDASPNGAANIDIDRIAEACDATEDSG